VGVDKMSALIANIESRLKEKVIGDMPALGPGFDQYVVDVAASPSAHGFTWFRLTKEQAIHLCHLLDCAGKMDLQTLGLLLGLIQTYNCEAKNGKYCPCT